MTTTQLAGSLTDALPEGTDMPDDAAPPSSQPSAGGLVFDSTMEGLTLDEVAVVLVAERPVLIPLSRAQASDAGFPVVDVPDDVLLGLGVSPRRSVAPVVVAPVVVAPVVVAPVVVDPVPAPVAPPVQSPVRSSSPAASVGSSPVAPVGSSPVGSAPAPAAPVETYVPRHASPASAPVDPVAPVPVAVSAPPVAAPIGLPSFDSATPVARSFDEVPVAPARPINSMAASHRDWEPEALAWPYIDRRSAAEADAAPDPATVPVPRSLSSGRPVNMDEPAEIVIRLDVEPRPELVVDVHGLAARTVRPLTMQVRAGSMVVVSGTRGSGKSSVLRVLAGLDEPTGGMGRVNDLDLRSLDEDERAEREAISAGFVPQLPFLVPELTVAENVELPLLADGVASTMARRAAEAMIGSFGLGTHTHAPSEVLSGAEIRLAAIARALVTQDRIVFLDEPIAGLSDADARVVVDHLVDLVGRGAAVVMVCTDPRVRLLGVRHVVLNEGTIVRDDIATTLS